jgi:hypothetical protein
MHAKAMSNPHHKPTTSALGLIVRSHHGSHVNLLSLYYHSEDISSSSDDHLMPNSSMPNSSMITTFHFDSFTLNIQNLDGPDACSIAGRIWRCSLLVAVRISGLPALSVDSSPTTRAREKLSAALISCKDKHVMELGCGRGLGGRAAGLSASSVTFTDVNDSVLLTLRQELLASPLTSESHVRHHLWASDQRILEHLASPVQEGDEAPEEERRVRRLAEADAFKPLRHWSDSKRDDRISCLVSDTTYDVILASDCLYFSDQEEGLASTLLLRMRKPGGSALIAFQPRGNNSSCCVRLASELRRGGMAVDVESGPWDHYRMGQVHMAEDHQLHTMCQDSASEIELLTCHWV